MDINFHKLWHDHHRPAPLATWLFGLALAAGLGVQCIGAWTDSQTTDEAVHLTSGYSYLQTGDFRLNPEHPPLIKYLAATPLLFLKNLNWSTASLLWKKAASEPISQWRLGAQFVYDSRPDINFSRVILFLARLPMILVWATLAWVLFAWGRQRWGPWAGVLAATFFIFDPNFLGHGHLVLTDVGISLGYAATIWLVDRFFSQPTWSKLWWLTFVFSLAQMTKFSAVILWFIIPVLGLIRLLLTPTALTKTWLWRLIGGLVIVSSLTTWATYQFELKSLDDVGQASGTATKPSMSTLAHWPIPAVSYLVGLKATTDHNTLGHPAFLNGHFSEFGWWYYFPEAMLLKMPIITLVLLLAFAVNQLRRLFMASQRRSPRYDAWSAWLLTLPPAIYLLGSMTGHINIGVRHVFPVYPFLYLAIGSLTTMRWSYRWFQWWQALAVSAAILIATVWFAWPHTIGYFSALAGGTNHADRYLLDSNLDWGQDSWRLRDFLNRQHITSFQTVPFNWTPMEKIFPQSTDILTDQHIKAGQRPSGIVVMRVSYLWWPIIPLKWIHAYTPRWRVGSEILIYDFR